MQSLFLQVEKGTGQEKIFPFPAGPGSDAGAQPLDGAQVVLVLPAWPMQASPLGV